MNFSPPSATPTNPLLAPRHTQLVPPLSLSSPPRPSSPFSSGPLAPPIKPSKPWTQLISDAYADRNDLKSKESSQSAVAHVRQLVLHHRNLAVAFINTLASNPTNCYLIPSSIVPLLIQAQVKLNIAVCELQTHLDLHVQSHTTLMAAFSQANQITSLLRTLHSCEQSLQLALTPASSHLAQLDSTSQLELGNILDYAAKVTSQTSAPVAHDLITGQKLPGPMVAVGHIKPTFAPDELQMRLGLLYQMALTKQGVVTNTVPDGHVTIGAMETTPGNGSDPSPNITTTVTDSDVTSDSVTSVRKEGESISVLSGGASQEVDYDLLSVLDEDGALNFDF